MRSDRGGISRRGFARMLGAGAAFAAAHPAGVHGLVVQTPAGVGAAAVAPPARALVRLSSNENPYGPSPAALRAMNEAFGLAWRYPDEHAEELAAELAKMHGVTAKQIILGSGSGEILKLAAAAFTGPGRGLVVADPTFEAVVHHATAARAEVSKVSLTPDYRHDLPKMLAAAGASAGLVYVCNPNNPTATVTPKEELRAFLSKTPRETVVLVDEAYHHYVETADYESLIPLVAEHPNLVVARTFSKIYGMAGLRCGYCVAPLPLVGRMRAQQAWDSVNIMAVVAALASLRDAAQVDEGRRRNTEVKRYVYAELERLGFKYIPSAANFLMFDLRADAHPFIEGMRQRGVEVGRFFPALPTHMRVTVGTRADMQSFVSALRQLAAPA